MRDVFDLPHLIADVIADVQATAEDKGVHVAAHNLAAMPQWVDGDEASLRRILLNTLDLVVGAATGGAVILRLDPHESLADRWICVVGWRGDGDSGIDEVKSAFIVALQAADSADNAGPFRILVVDDSAQHRAIVSAYLAPTPHIVTEADSGEEAMTRMREGAFDVILMDVQMPGMGGLEAIRAVREYESGDHLPRSYIVALTTMGESDDAMEAELAGADGWLPKPLGRDALFRMLSAVPTRAESSERPGAPSERPGASSERPGFSPAVTVGLPFDRLRAPRVYREVEPDGSEETHSDETHGQGPLLPAQLLAVTRHQLGTILMTAPGTQVERLRLLGQNLKTTAADAGLADIAHLAAILEEAGATGSLTDSQTAARTLQAWILRSGNRRS